MGGRCGRCPQTRVTCCQKGGSGRMAAAMSSVSSLRVAGGVYSSRRSAGITGNKAGLKFNKGSAVVTMRKKDIHPEWFEESEVMFCGGTREQYVVDIWSGNHPFFTGNSNVMVVDEGQVNRFSKRYAGLGSLTDLSNLSQAELSPEEIAEARKAAKLELEKLKGPKGKGKGRK